MNEHNKCLKSPTKKRCFKSTRHWFQPIHFQIQNIIVQASLFSPNFGATKQQKHFKAAIGDCSSKRLPLACMEMVYLPIPIQHENQGFHLGKYTSPMDRMRMRKQNKQITRIPSHLAVSLVILPLCHIACAIRQREHLKRRKPLVGWVGGNGCK